MDEKTYLERKQLREKLEALPQWSDILRYADSRCSQAVATHDSRLSESDPVYKKSLYLYKMAVSKCIDMKINPQLLDVLFLKFISEDDLDKKLNALKNIKKYYL